MKIILSVPLIVFFSLRVNAQALQLNKADSLWHIKITATGLYADGNQPRSLFTNKVNVDKFWKKAAIISNNIYQYGTIGRSKLVVYNDIRSENILILLPRKRFSAFIREFAEINKLRKIDFRNELAGGGLYKLVAGKPHQLTAMAGIIYQATDYKGTVFNIIDNHGSDKRKVWKWAVGLTGFNTIVKNRLNTEYRVLYMQNLSLAKDNNYVADISLNAKIIKGLSFTVNYFRTFESVEMKNILSREVQLTYGLTYQF